MGESGLFQLRCRVHWCDSPTISPRPAYGSRSDTFLIDRGGNIRLSKTSAAGTKLVVVVYQSLITLQEIATWVFLFSLIYEFGSR